MNEDDLIMAFFPCIFFTGSSNPPSFRLDCINYRKLSMKETFDTIIKRANDRNYLYTLLYKFVAIVMIRGLRLIIENPYSTLHYLHNNFIQEPSIIDKNRRLRGDYFTKPTGFWYFNCEPTHGQSFQKPEKELTIRTCKPAKESGLCSEERSMISPDYARNFIHDFILGKPQKMSQLNLFE
jgi:hypothetical protein